MNYQNLLETFSNPTFLWISFLTSISFIVLSAIIFPVVILLLPRDYFLYEGQAHPWLKKRSPGARTIIIFLKNILGALLLIAGIAMLFLPGQGLLTCLVALSLLDYPGKFQLIRSIIRRKSVFRAMNGLRLYFKKDPLKVPRVAKEHSKKKDT
jgi:hypothetical protein